MKRRLSSPVLICALTAIVFGGLMLGPFMHETDQGWLLDGGAAIADGHMEIARAEFNFDKQFISYFLPAALFKFLPQPFQPDMLVLAGNILGFCFFWVAFVWLLRRRLLRLPLALALPVILTPAFLVHSAFYASAFVSAAFLLLLAGVLACGKTGWQWRGLVYVLAFCATGARADALLLLPLLAMLHSPQRTFASVVKSRNTWLMAAGGLTAFFFGRHFYTEILVDYVAHHLHLKQLLAYAVFGLGGAGLLLLVELHAVWRARAGRCRWWTFFLALGLAMPSVYYGLQLISTRHCVVPALSALFFLTAKPGRIMLRIYFRKNIFSIPLRCALAVTAVLPVFVGVNIADSSQSAMSLCHPTLLPTVAGASPAGAYLEHAVNVRRQRGFMDHNQAIWNAAKETRFEAEQGIVSIAATPVESYLIFAIRLQGLVPRHFILEAEPRPARFYLESRSLMRFPYIWPPNILPLEKFFAAVTLSPATHFNWHGITVLQGQTNPAGFGNGLPAELWVFNSVFGGDEFRLEPVAFLKKIPADWTGKKLALASRGNFTVSGRLGIKTRDIRGAFGVWQACEIDSLRADETIAVAGASSEEIFAAVGALPEWMSVRKF